ncbi:MULTISPECIES: alanine racemase [Hyphobacterium]|uniref:Alanine racemase n=1 Tax=Hyphobacterium vulgare TaxID=1736751 RepID=A0ABV7A113_9PROT
MTTPSGDAVPYPQLIVDLGAIRRNYARLQTMTSGTEVAAVVKADAYGLGAAAVAPVLLHAGARHFFVANAHEGAVVRSAVGNDAEIFVLHGYWPADARVIARSSLSPVINTAEQLGNWLAGPAGPYALHFDTGMNRLGVPMSELRTVADIAARRAPELIMSHFACADEPGHALNATQIERFSAVRDAFPGVRTSLANSAGCLLDRAAHGDLVRPGIALYGGAPRATEVSPFESAATIETPILQIRAARSGGTAGYGATWSADSDRTLAIVALGYADGMFRAAQQGGYGRIGDVKVPIAGRVSMDLITLDVTAAGDAAKAGETVRFLGPDLDAFAAASGTLAYEVLTRLGPRLERVYT